MSSPWADAAYDELQKFVANMKGEFLACEIRKTAERNGLPPAHDDRAWASIVQRAQRAGLIEQAGYAPSPDHENGRPVFSWRAA